MRNFALFTALTLSFMGTVAAADAAGPIISYLGSTSLDTAGDTGSSGDSGGTETGDTDTDDTGDDTGEPVDTGDDTGDTGTSTDGYSAAELAGELGGFGCATLGGKASGLVAFGSVLLLLWRRED